MLIYDIWAKALVFSFSLKLKLYPKYLNFKILQKILSQVHQRLINSYKSASKCEVRKCKFFVIFPFWILPFLSWHPSFSVYFISLTSKYFLFLLDALFLLSFNVDIKTRCKAYSLLNLQESEDEYTNIYIIFT